jgi:hypothetical protein
MILALQGSGVDVIAQFDPAAGTSLLNNSSYIIIKLKSANHCRSGRRTSRWPKQLLSAAGHPSINTTLLTERYQEISRLRK